MTREEIQRRGEIRRQYKLAFIRAYGDNDTSVGWLEKECETFADQMLDDDLAFEACECDWEKG